MSENETKTDDPRSLERIVSLLREACAIFREATFQSHSGHWDATMQRGAGCPECIRARELRAKGDALVKQANDEAQRRVEETS